MLLGLINFYKNLPRIVLAIKLVTVSNALIHAPALLHPDLPFAESEHDATHETTEPYAHVPSARTVILWLNAVLPSGVKQKLLQF